MKLNLVLPGSIRSKKNSKIATIIGGKNKPRRAIILPSKAYTIWENEARAAVWMQLKKFKGVILPTDKLVEIKIIAHYKGPKPDLSGAMESVGDCLEKLIYTDDANIISWDGSRLCHDLHHPRTEVEVNIIEEQIS